MGATQTSEMKVKLFRLGTGEIVIAQVNKNKMKLPFAVIMQQQHPSQPPTLGFQPFLIFSEEHECSRFNPDHVLMEYEPEEGLKKNYLEMARGFEDRFKAAKAGLVLDTNVKGAADNVRQFKQIIGE